MASQFTKLLSRFFSKLIWLISIGLIIFVLAISLLKVSLPYWIKQKDSIVNYAEAYIGGEIDYQSIQVNWSDFHPVVEISNLSWKAPSQKFSLQSQHNRIELDLWRTLYHGELVTKDIELKDLLLEFNTSQTNNSVPFDMKEFKRAITSASQSFRHEYVSLVDLELKLARGNDSEVVSTQSIPQLIYKQDESQRQLLLDTYGSLVEKGRLVIESKGDLFLDNSQISYFADIKKINLIQLSKQFNLSSISDYENINLKAWISQKGDQVESSRLELNNGATSNAAKVDIAINLATNSGFYSVTSDRFDISVKDNDEYVTHNSFLSLSHLSKNNHSQYSIQTGVIPVGFLTNLLLPLLDDELVNLNFHLQPKGLIKSVDLILNQTVDGITAQHGNISATNFSLKPYQQIPGIEFDKITISGIDGNWYFNGVAQSTMLDWRPMLKAEREIEYLELDAHWNSASASEIKVDKFRFENKDAKVKARASLQLADEFSMAIYAEAETINIANLHYYWPREPGLSPRALEYLDQSLIGGEVPFAKFIWQGAVEAFPFKDKSGQFDIQASTRNARFKFQPDWPMATGLNASASFENEALKIKANSGNLLGVQVLDAKAVIPDLKAPDEELFIDIKAKSDFDSYSKLFKQSPLEEMLGPELLDISFSDTLDIELSLDFLLAKDIEANVTGVIDFNGNQIKGIPYNIELANTEGQLKFTDNGAISKNLTAEVFGSVMDIELKVDEYTDDGSFLQLDAQGSLNLAKSANQLLKVEPLNISGASDFFIHYKVDKEQDGNESLIVRSDLVGSMIEGPSWLAKESLQSAPLLATLFKKNNELKIRASYSDQMSTQLTINTDQAQELTGLIKLGGVATQSLELPKEGVAIEGYFDQVIVAKWLDALQFNVSETEDTEWPSWIDRINITTPKLIFADQQFTNVRINDVKSVDNQEQDIRFNLFSEQARANVTYLKNGQKQLIIEHLRLTPEIKDESSDTPIDIDLAEYDNWLFECRDCKINGYQFGPLRLESDYKDNQIQISGSGYVSDQLTSIINGTIDENQTKLAMTFDVPNPSGLLKYWGLAGEIRDTKTIGQLNLQWPGRLHDFSLIQTDGQFNVSTGDGSIKDLSDRKARIFSLFSLQSIPRRLSLDFSDIFRDGFFYDRITGNFTIEKGVLKSEKVEIKGTAADVVVNGSVNLNNQTVDQQVIVTPKLSSSLPVLAGWAIEPTTGLIMLIVSKIFEPALNVVSSIEYKISGALEDPQVVEVSKKSKEIEVTDEQIEAQKKSLQIEDEPTNSNSNDSNTKPTK